MKKKEPAILEKRRLRAVSMVTNGMSQSKVAMAFHVSRQSVSRWVQAFRVERIDGLKRKRKPGRPPKMTDVQMGELIELLGRATEHSKGRPMGSTEIAGLILDQFGIKFHRNHIPRLLRSLKNRKSWPEDPEESTDAKAK